MAVLGNIREASDIDINSYTYIHIYYMYFFCVGKRGKDCFIVLERMRNILILWIFMTNTNLNVWEITGVYGESVLDL